VRRGGAEPEHLIEPRNRLERLAATRARPGRRIRAWRHRDPDLAGPTLAVGHEVIAREIEVDDVGAVTARERPDVALVGLGESCATETRILQGTHLT
jgi:hypothetical protein